MRIITEDDMYTGEEMGEDECEEEVE